MRSLLRVIAVCSAALFVPLMLPLVTGRVFTLDDLGAYHIPMRYLYAAALHRGETLLWTPSVFAGDYVFGEGQVGMAHPWHLFLYRFLPLNVAFNLEIISSYVVMFPGMVLLLKRLRLSTAAAWFGAMVFTFSGYNLFHLIHVNIVAAVAHIPWILLLIHGLVNASDRKTRVRSFIALTLVVASQILVGHTQQVWFTLLLVGGLCVYFLWNNIAFARILWVPLALMLAALVAGVQLLPLFDAVRSSQRSDWVPFFSLTFSLVPSNIIQLWSPFFFTTGIRAISIEQFAVHEFIVYNGAFCTVALAWIAIRWRGLPHKNLTRGLLLLGTVALILAFGRYGGLYTSLLAVPGLRWFRAPTRHLMVVHLSLSVLAAIVLDDVLDLVRRREMINWQRLWPLAVPCALSLGTAVVAAILIASGSREPLSGVTATAPWLALFVVVPLLFAAAARGKPWAPLLLVVIAAADQGYWGYQYLFGEPLRPLMTIDEMAMLARVPESGQSGDLIDTRPGVVPFQNDLILRGFRVWQGYVGLPPVLRLNNTNTTAQLAGAKWRATESGFAPIQPAVERARLLTKARVSSNVADDILAINVLDEALVDRSIGDLSGPPGSARVVEDVPGRIVVDTTSPGRQLLALTERFDSGWRVTDDVLQPAVDPPAPSSGGLVRVYGDFLGYEVGPGAHRVTFRFSPASYARGLWVTALGLLVVLCVMLFAF